MSRATYEAGSTSLSDFKQVSLLGEGAYSSVYKVLRLADNGVYALKKVKLPQLSDKEKQNALNEVRLLASVQHENVVGYKEAFFDDKTRCLCIVQEMADSGDLLQQITKCKQDRVYLREADIWRYLNGMCQGLKALHDLRILHRDMKCANVFLNASKEGPIAKLGDFNVSKVAKRGLCMTQTGTPYYASPEVWRDMPYDAKSDMWSLGCVLYEMVALRPPFRAEDMEGLYRKVVRGQYPRIPSHFSTDMGDVIGALLQVHPRHRPTVDQLMQMPAMLRHREGRIDMVVGDDQSDLLNTIKLPKNAIDLSGCLPKPRYGQAGYPKTVAQADDEMDVPGSVGAEGRRQPQLPPLPGAEGAGRTPQVGTRSLAPLPPPNAQPQADRTDSAQQQEEAKDSLDAYMLQQRNQEQTGPGRPELDASGAGTVAQANAGRGVYGSGTGAARAQQPPPSGGTRQGASRQPRLPMSIYARQQYQVVDQYQQGSDAPKESTARPPRRTPMMPCVF